MKIQKGETGVTKEDIVNRVWEKLDISKKQSGELIDHLITSIKDILTDGEKLKIGGFGVFEVRRRKPRMGRNPKTGEKAGIKEGKTLKFKPGKTLKQNIAK
jgi:nucleoid DNA-binding protein